MISRRALLVGSTTLAACSRSRGAATAGPRTSEVEGITFHEIFTKGADDSAPLLVAIHGRGDRPEPWVASWSTFPARARIAIPRAFTKSGDGFSWFEYHPGMTDADLGTAIGDAETRLWKGIASIARGKRVRVTGFSQGGMLSFVAAARHPDVIAHAFPVAGATPAALFPKARPAPVSAFHGDADDVVKVQHARDTVAAFRAAGGEVELKEYAGVRHALSEAEHTDLWRAIGSKLT